MEAAGTILPHQLPNKKKERGKGGKKERGEKRKTRNGDKRGRRNASE